MAPTREQLGQGTRITLFGRFRTLPKKRIEHLLKERGAQTLRDLTRNSTHLVVGETALGAFDMLLERLRKADRQNVAVLGERRLMDILSGQTDFPEPTLPVDRSATLEPELVQLLSIFNLITLNNGHVAFADGATFKSAASLVESGMDWPDVLRALLERQDSPKGRHRIVVGPNGAAMLEWEDGVTTLSGQHVLPLDEGDDLDDLFEQALDAEAAGDLVTAARLFETCALADRKDALSSFNLGNVRRAMADLPGAQMAFRQAIARDPRFGEAHFNLAGVLEMAGNFAAAKDQLRQANAVDKRYAEALFNLAQLELADENFMDAKVLFERCLATGTAGSLEAKAERALHLISSKSAR